MGARRRHSCSSPHARPCFPLAAGQADGGGAECFRGQGGLRGEHAGRPGCAAICTQAASMRLRLCAPSTLAALVCLQGNHDFDFGVENFSKLSAECRFPWLMANVLEDESGLPLGGASPTAIIEWQGVRVGLIGEGQRWRSGLLPVSGRGGGADTCRLLCYAVRQGTRLGVLGERLVGVMQVASTPPLLVHGPLLGASDSAAALCWRGRLLLGPTHAPVGKPGCAAEGAACSTASGRCSTIPLPAFPCPPPSPPIQAWWKKSGSPPWLQWTRMKCATLILWPRPGAWPQSCGWAAAVAAFSLPLSAGRQGCAHRRRPRVAAPPSHVACTLVLCPGEACSPSARWPACRLVPAPMCPPPPPLAGWQRPVFSAPGAPVPTAP